MLKGKVVNGKPLPIGRSPQGLQRATENYQSPGSTRTNLPIQSSQAPRQPLMWRRAQAVDIPPFAQQPPSKEFVPEFINYVVQATCKRIRTIPAQKLCARGILNGKMCRVEIEVPPVISFGDNFDFDTQPPQDLCPEGFNLASRTACILSELKSMLLVCPDETQDIGDRCATYLPPTMVCPPHFALETEKTCVRTLHAPPITEFTLKYACLGKDCAN